MYQENIEDLIGTYCQCCGTYVYYESIHVCNGIGSCSTPMVVNPESRIRTYKCPRCKGGFSNPAMKFTGKYKDEEITELGNKDVVVAKQKTPICKYVCPFCEQAMKGLNQ